MSDDAKPRAGAEEGGPAPRADAVDGFFGVDSMVRRLHGERLVLFSGARALLMQACEPLGVLGFERHSIIFDDPRTRLRRTDERMSRVYFGTAAQAEETGRVVRAMHRRVRGVTAEAYGPIPAGTPYAASDPALGCRGPASPTAASGSPRSGARRPSGWSSRRPSAA